MLNVDEIQVINDVKEYLGIDMLDIDLQKCDEDGLNVIRSDKHFDVKYNSRSDMFRALGLISLYGDEITEISQKKRTESLGYLVDTARNAVPRLETLKELFIRLAAFGYDRVYFYCEDVMQIENEPYYGLLRGRYSFDEIREMDAYAYELGIEVVPCIQTLAHLNCLFKWNEYMQCNDTADILLIDSDRTYKLINNIFLTISHCFRSKHVHIGMDEAYLVGRGRHMDMYGYEEKHDLLKRHIDMVMNIAGKYGFTAEIWSDMYFREAFGGAYYSADGQLSDEVCKEIPKNVGLVYWDYWNRDERVIDNMFQNHIKTGNKISFAGGAWKWSGWNPSTQMAFTVGRKMLDACTRYDIKNISVTAWSDDGAEASIFVALPSIILYSQYAYGQSTDDSAINEILEKFSGISLEEYCALDLNFFDECMDEPYLFGTLPKILLYNDPLSPFYDGILQKYDITSKIEEYASRLRAIKGGSERDKKEFEILALLCDVLTIKWDLGLRIRSAYQQKEFSSLKNIVDIEIPTLISRLSKFKGLFYERWMRENKSNGFGTHDLRIGGVVERLKTVQTLVNAYLNKEISEISELEENLIPEEENSALDMLLWTTWKRIHTLYVM